MSNRQIIINKENTHIGIQEICYPYHTKGKLFYFYDGDGEKCIPIVVTESLINVNIISEDQRNFVISFGIEGLLRIFKDANIGSYIFDLSTGKLVFDMNVKKWFGFFSVLSPQKKYKRYLAAFYNDGVFTSPEVCFIKGDTDSAAFSYAQLTTASFGMLEPKLISTFGCEVFKQIGLITREFAPIGMAYDSIDLSDFLIPSSRFRGQEFKLNKLNDLINKALPPKEEETKPLLPEIVSTPVSSNYKPDILLSKILHERSFPVHLANGNVSIPVTVDKEFENVKIRRVDFDTRCIYFYLDTKLDTAALRNLFNIDNAIFIIY